MRPSLRTHVAAQELGDRIGVQRRGHRHHGQIGTVGLAQAPQPGEREIRRDVALVKLVEHDGRRRRGSRGAASIRRMKRPSVMKRTRVFGPPASSKRTE